MFFYFIRFPRQDSEGTGAGDEGIPLEDVNHSTNPSLSSAESAHESTPSSKLVDLSPSVKSSNSSSSSSVPDTTVTVDVEGDSDRQSSSRTSGDDEDTRTVPSGHQVGKNSNTSARVCAPSPKGPEVYKDSGINTSLGHGSRTTTYDAGEATGSVDTVNNDCNNGDSEYTAVLWQYSNHSGSHTTTTPVEESYPNTVWRQNS